MTSNRDAQAPEQLVPEGGGGFSPRKKPAESTWALAPERPALPSSLEIPSSSISPHQGKKKTLWAWTIATFFGAGLGKPGPGTWGSVAAVLLWAACARFLHPTPQVLLIALAAGIVLSIALGVPAATIAARESGRHDPGFVVIDEVAGQWIALLFSPFDWRHALIALILFRLFDITKPFPARQLESLPEGWGIVFDDVAAGLYALGVASLLRIWF
ncbi:MAG TPA: phosphatidylglycerophosphatase A [Terracidiphilus sp.]|jgi:phosphatidylglycerophosphatase A